MRVASMHPASVPEWDAQEMLTGRLSDEVWPADEEQARAMLDEVRVELPDEPQHTDLVAFAGERSTPLDEKLLATTRQHAFHLIGMPVPVVVPDDRRLVRLRLRLELSDEALAWDVFPRTEWAAETHELGTASLDVGKALTFVAPPFADALGLKIEFPLRFTTHVVRVQSTGPNSNPVDWLVKGDRVREGFTAWLILRAAKDTSVAMSAKLACELRRSGPFGRLLRATYTSDEERYAVAAP